MSQQRIRFRRSAIALTVGALCVAGALAACGSGEPGGLVSADPGLTTGSLPSSTGTTPPPRPPNDDGYDTSASSGAAPEVADPGQTTALAPTSVADSGAVSEAPASDSDGTTVPVADEPCVTVVTTIPGQRFCDSYNPFPETSDDPNNPAPCPPWATEPVTRPAGGWLGANTTPPDYLLRAGVHDIDNLPALTALAQAADELLPSEYEPTTIRATGAPACVEATLTLRAVFRHPDGSTVTVLSDRLFSQFDWSLQPPSGLIERRSLDSGAELATGNYSEGLALRVWVAQPDGALLRVIAFGANAPTFAGYPTTIPPQSTSVAPTPVPMTLDQVVDIALALAGGG